MTRYSGHKLSRGNESDGLINAGPSVKVTNEYAIDGIAAWVKPAHVVSHGDNNGRDLAWLEAETSDRLWSSTGQAGSYLVRRLPDVVEVDHAQGGPSS